MCAAPNSNFLATQRMKGQFSGHFQRAAIKMLFTIPFGGSVFLLLFGLIGAFEMSFQLRYRSASMTIVTTCFNVEVSSIGEFILDGRRSERHLGARKESVQRNQHLA